MLYIGVTRPATRLEMVSRETRSVSEGLEPGCLEVPRARVGLHLRVVKRFLLFGLLVHGGASVAAAEEPRPLRFETDVRRMLKAHCWQCHGEDPELKGGLDTRLVRFLLKGGESGSAIVAGKHSKSLLYQRVAAGEMPPGEKKLSQADLDVLARWIDEGARTVRPEPETLADGDTFTVEERQHWSFQPIRRPSLPAVKHPDRVRSPIDIFLLSRLDAHGLAFGPEADRETLIRRLYFNLVGLPPAPDAIDRFATDNAPNAYERLVDDLLASPAYGERWARHWLDVAGYADSDGYTEQDTVRPWAYHYRDYVIRAFNADKAWDEFLVEQLAGDELLTPPYRNLTARQADRLIATGFLRMGPDGTGASNVDTNAARNAVISETIKITTTSILGLSVGCAQCHDHRYDPITQSDYYRFRALIEPAYDWQKWRAPAARLVSLWSADELRQAEAVADALQKISEKRTAELDMLVRETFERKLRKLPAELQAEAKQVRETPAKQRSEQQRQLIEKHPFLTLDRNSLSKFATDETAALNKKWDELVKAAQSKRPADNCAMCLTEEPSRIPVTRLFSRGDFQQPRQEIKPGELAVLNAAGLAIPSNDPQLPTSGRRLAYARHLTNGKHPLVARVLVNRIWLHHFGQGLVATPSDFGMLGEEPSHPELLDWLADDFTAGGWKLKRLHRMIVTSTAYRQTSTRRRELDAVDPENRLLGRMFVRRLEAETIRDSLLAVSGQLTGKMYGPPVPVSPDVVGQIVVAVDTRDGGGRPTGKVIPLGADEFRRSIYVQVRRSMPLSVLEPFDLPILTPNCERRPSSTTAPQALLMMNNPFIIRQAGALAARIQREAGADRAAQFQLAWRLVLGRSASDAELRNGVVFLEQEIAAARADPETTSSDPVRVALARLCQALLCSNGFLYVE